MHFFIDQVAFQSEMRGPLFKCEANSDGSLRLHYYSVRNGLFPMVKGLVAQAAKSLFDIDVRVFVTERSQEKRNNTVTDHVIFTVEAINDNIALVKDNNSIYRSLQTDASINKTPLGISIQSFAQMFPMHVCFNKQMIIEHCGEFLQKELNLGKRKMTKLTEIFQLVQPEDVQLSFKGFLACLNSLFVFQIKTTLARNEKKNVVQKRPLVVKGISKIYKSQNITFFRTNDAGQQRAIHVVCCFNTYVNNQRTSGHKCIHLRYENARCNERLDHVKSKQNLSTRTKVT